MSTGPDEQRALERSLSRRARELFPDLPGDRPMPRLGDGVVRKLDMVERYAALTAVACDRAEWFGAMLDEQVGMARGRAEQVLADVDGAVDPEERRRALTRLGLYGPPGSEGLIGFTYAAAVVGEGDSAELERIETGEGIRALVVLEGQERDRAAKLLHQGIKIGIQASQVEAMRAYGDTVALSLIHFARELGIDSADTVVGRAAARAVLRARQELGANEGDPDRDGGAALSDGERRAVLTRAMAPAGAGG